MARRAELASGKLTPAEWDAAERRRDQEDLRQLRDRNVQLADRANVLVEAMGNAAVLQRDMQREIQQYRQELQAMTQRAAVSGAEAQAAVEAQAVAADEVSAERAAGICGGTAVKASAGYPKRTRAAASAPACCR